MDFKQIFGKRLKKYRLSLNMSQEIFAERVGLSRNTISRAETGVSSPTAENLSKIRTSLNTDLNRLLDFNDNNNLETIELVQNKLRILNENELLEIDSHIDAIIKENTGE